MPVIIPPGQGKKQIKKKVKGAAIKPAKAVETQYMRMFRQNAALMAESASQIYTEVQARTVSLASIRARLDLAESTILDQTAATQAATGIVNSANNLQKKRFERVLAKAFGVDVIAVIDTIGIRKAIDVAIQRNVDLIKTVRRNYFSGIREAVYNNFAGVGQPENRTLLQQIQHVGKGTKSRAKVIARDQAQKLNANFSQVRQEEAGIDGYIWRTAKDNRVVGAPGGLYPKPTRLHGDHFRREGKEFKWADPPPDGHPGEPIMCRCVAEPIIDREKIMETTEARFA